MATVDFFTGFTYKWAQTGNTFAWDDAQYKLGWATVGDTPPTVEQFNRVHQIADEKSNWLYGQLKTVADAKSVTLSAGSLTGLQQVLAAYTPNATETVAGIIELATNAEVQAGTDAVRAVTPAGLASLTATDTRRGLIELATEAEAQAWSDTTRAITPAMLAAALQGANSSLLASGYQKLPGGLIIQWGVGPSSANTTTSVSFPIAFPGAVLQVVAAGLNVNGNYQGYVTLNSFSNGGFQCNCFNATGGSPPTLTNAVNGVSVRWIAVGY